MAIVSSEIIDTSLQADGRAWITERHVDHLGRELIFTYLRTASDPTVAAQLAQRAIDLVDDERLKEIGKNIIDVITNGSLATPAINYSTVAQNFAALRLVYQYATRTEAIMIGDFLNTLTNAQLATAFGITQAQAQTLRTNKLAPAATVAAEIRASAGQ